MLKPPPTLRLATASEVPKRPEILARIKQGKEAAIVEGFTLQQNSTHELPFVFYAEVNVDNNNFWKLFLALTNMLPDIASCLYGAYEEEPMFSEYGPKEQLLIQLNKFSLELSQDCYLEFGLIHQTDETLVEVFVDNSKYLKVWGINEVQFRQILGNFSIFEIEELNFFDEFPKVIVPLINLNPEALSTEVVLSSLITLLP